MITKRLFSVPAQRLAAAAAVLLLAAGAPVKSDAALHHTRHAGHAYMHKTLTHRRHAASALVTTDGQRRTPTDSYLKYKVYSVSDITTELSANPRLVDYYAKTWHKSDAYVMHYISNYVQESYIPETSYYTVYCVRPNGVVYPTKQRMVKGTKVFALRNGEPIMKWLCGNPLSKYLPVVYPAKPAVIKTKDVVQLLPQEQQQELVPSETPVIAPATPVHILPTAVTRLITSAGSHAISPAYLALAGLPFLHTNHGGGSSNVIPLSPGHPTSPSGPGTGLPVSPTPPGSPTGSGGTGLPSSPTAPGSPSYPTGPLSPTPPASPTAVPEIGSGAIVAFGLLPLALLAWRASSRRKVTNV